MDDIAPFQPPQEIPTPVPSYTHGHPFARKTPYMRYIVLFIILAGGFAGSMLMLRSSREIRSKASDNGPVLSLNPATKQLATGQTATLGVLLNTNGETVSVVKLQLSHDPAAIQVTGFSAGTILPVILSPAVYTNGKIDITLAVPPSSPFKGSGVVGTITIKALSNTNSTIQFTSSTEVASLSKTTNSLASTSGSSITQIPVTVITTTAPVAIVTTLPPTPVRAQPAPQPATALVDQFDYGIPGDIPVTGNWNSGKTDLPAIIRGKEWFMKKTLSGGNADMTVSLENIPADGKKYYLACDWTGSGVKTPAVFVNGVWYIRTTNTSGSPDLIFPYGLPTDIPICGNWTGRNDGIQTVGVFRGNTWLLRNSNTEGFAEIEYKYGLPGDIPIVGHWTGTKQDLPGIYQGNSFYTRNSHTEGFADTIITFGNTGDTPIVGDWTGEGKSLIGVVRGNKWFLNSK